MIGQNKKFLSRKASIYGKLDSTDMMFAGIGLLVGLLFREEVRDLVSIVLAISFVGINLVKKKYFPHLQFGHLTKMAKRANWTEVKFEIKDSNDNK